MHSVLISGSVIAFALGVGLRTLYEIPQTITWWLLLVALAVGLVWRRNSFAVSAPHLLGASLCFLFFSLGILRTEIFSWQFDSSPLAASVGQSVELTGVVVAEPDYREKMVHLHVQTGEDKLLVTSDRLQNLTYGDQVVVAGKLKRPEAFVTELGRTFDYPGYLLAKGIEYQISFAEVTVTDHGLGKAFISALLTAKQHFIDSVQTIITEPAVSLGNGLLLGVKSTLGDDIEQDFRQTGIIHIVVLSGYNVMLVVAFIMFCFSYFLPFRLRIIAGVVAIICFALIVGLSATVVRASVMAALVLVAQAVGRRYDVLRALLLAGVVMLLINPYLLLYDIGFQLSFMATLGLILIVPQFESTVVRKGERLGVREFFLATVATQIAVLPLLMYHIGEVSLIAVVVNVLVLPVVPLAMLLTFFTGLLGFVSVSLASVAGYTATLLLTYILLVAHWFAVLPFATVSIATFPAAGIFLLYLVMGGMWYFLKVRVRESDSLSDWTIETETADELKDSPAATAEVPIFFR